MQDTFLHEVFHAIVHVMDLKETETEENYVRRLATGLCTVWNNNPAAFKWWSGVSIQPKLAAPEADAPPFSVSIDKQGIRLHSLKGFQDSH